MFKDFTFSHSPFRAADRKAHDKMKREAKADIMQAIRKNGADMPVGSELTIKTRHGTAVICCK